MLNHVKIKLLRKPKREKFFIFFLSIYKEKAGDKEKKFKRKKTCWITSCLNQKIFIKSCCMWSHRGANISTGRGPQLMNHFLSQLDRRRGLQRTCHMCESPSWWQYQPHKQRDEDLNRHLNRHPAVTRTL